MAFSKTTGYGIRALAYLASQPLARLCELGEIAKKEGIPPVYLRKVMSELRRRRLLHSVKGVHGGYELTRKPDEISLWEVFQILDPEPYRFEQCILAHGNRAQDKPCAACQASQTFNQQYVDWLQATTIAHLQRL